MHTYMDHGAYTISATLTDEDGTFTAADTVSVNVAAVAPVLTIAGPTAVNEGPYTLNLAASNTFKCTSTVSQFRFEAKGETGLVGYWKLDEQTGTTAADTSGTGNTGTLTNGVRWWNQIFNNGTTASAIGSPIGFFYDGGWVDLDGTDDYISLGTTSIPVANASQSISLQVYYDATTATQQNFYSLVDATAAHNIQLGFHSSNIAAWKSGGTDLVTYAIPAASAWHHVVYTYDSSTATHKLYVDGTLRSTNTSTAADTAGSAPYYATIGAYRANGGTYGQFYDGRIDDVRVYNVALTAKQVKSMSQDKYPGLGSSVTWTLGADFSTGSFAMDNGTLDTSTFTVTASGNCYMPSGTFKKLLPTWSSRTGWPRSRCWTSSPPTSPSWTRRRSPAVGPCLRRRSTACWSSTLAPAGSWSGSRAATRSSSGVGWRRSRPASRPASRSRWCPG